MNNTPKHSKIGASSCDRYWNCPGSVALVAQCPTPPSSPYAEEGTAAHALGEKCLREGLDAIDLLGEVIYKDYEVTEEMAEAVQVYLDTIREDMVQYGASLEDLKIEHRFHLPDIDPNAYGTNDCNLTVFMDRVIVYDYKHGKGVAVEAEDNKQLQYYALGAVELGDYDIIEVVIVQPRLSHKDSRVRRWSLTKDQLMQFAEELKVRIAETKKPDAPRRCGEWCRKSFCPAMAVCPEVRGRVERDAMVVFSEPTITLPKVETLDKLTLRRLMDGTELIEAFLQAVWAYAMQRAEAGEEILNYKLVRGREGNRKWIDADKVKEIAETNKVSAPTHKMVLRSITELEKEVGKKEFQKIFGPAITRSEAKISLVPMSDPREAVQPNVLTVFGNEEIQ